MRTSPGRRAGRAGTGWRTRAGAYLAILTVGISIFGMLLFVTYYLQQNLRFSAIEAGLAFLPMTVGSVLMVAGMGRSSGSCRGPWESLTGFLVFRGYPLSS